MTAIHYRDRHFWTPAEIAEAAKICRRLMTSESVRFTMREVDRIIAEKLGLDIWTVNSRRRNYGNGFAREGGQGAKQSRNPSQGQIPARVFVERDARRDAAERCSLTQQILGDPPPGYSALDRRGR